MQQQQQQQYHTDLTTATRFPPDYRQALAMSGDGKYFGPAAALSSVPASDVPVTTYVQRLPSGVQPMVSVVSTSTAAPQLAQPQSCVATLPGNVNSLLPVQLNVAPSAAVSTTPDSLLRV